MTTGMSAFVHIPNKTPQTQSIQLVSAINIQKWIQRKTSIISCPKLIVAPVKIIA